LYKILSDSESMKHYPKPYTKEEVKDWIKRNINRYREHGFGLWAVELKNGNNFIGDCGITMQNINGTLIPEIGYHINKQFTGNGYATEAAQACKDYAFNTLGFQKIYSYMKFTNLSSARVAEKNGMKLEFEYDDPVNVVTKVYSITIEEYFNQSLE
ncbi:MAG: GNAT family N-acetyltransferase, partial [Vallitaleaceae bacterium]|nr:GNAT family N-acetyltransferase [Vallitaleaceae bacterium]